MALLKSGASRSNKQTARPTIQNIQKTGTASPRVIGARPKVASTIANIHKKTPIVKPGVVTVKPVATKSPVVHANPSKSVSSTAPAPPEKVKTLTQAPIHPVIAQKLVSIEPKAAPKVESKVETKEVAKPAA